MHAERTFLRARDVVVTSARLVVPAQTFAMRSITSVGVAQSNPSRIVPTILIVLGLAGLVGAKGFVVPAALALGLGLLVWALGRPTFTVLVRSPSGEVVALSSKERALVARIVLAVNEAIVANRA